MLDYDATEVIVGLLVSTYGLSKIKHLLYTSADPTIIISSISILLFLSNPFSRNFSSDLIGID